jgi:alpha-amylase/alpha-mannosidase (GH57 family)
MRAMTGPQRFITIHGHFYQPPRENPWLEAVETQDSAFPWHDWNARITAECYEPNATARVLDAQDRILRIVNNYSAISFNFGPTLLSWLQACAPDTYAAILEADCISRDRYSGHGCAIAQAYNHVILPLANDRDKATQVHWGLRDFEHRFGRKPEGMWLPETAVDVPSLEALAAAGIVFTILEPHQAAFCRPIGEKDWSPVHGAIDPTRPYLCPLPSGRSIMVFFYDGPISRAVAFEQLLARGENLAHRLAGAFNDTREHPQVVNIATDGETYGHHHRFGEMALAYALQLIEDQPLATLTNYGEHLQTHPPTHEVQIAESTSWSCSHGIERWRSDCGCNAGGGHGWTQQWRAPLRAALEWLRDEIDAIFAHHGARLLRDPWQAREDYIDVILDRSDESVASFLARHALSGDDEHEVPILELLEMQRNSMLMFTSCGWFFSDLSGIETVQVLHYAGRVLQLAERLDRKQLEPEFLTRLEPAHSNVLGRGTARQIYERDVLPARLDLSRVAAHYAVLSLFDTFDDAERVYCYEVVRRDLEIHKAGRARLSIGSIEVRSTITHETASFELAALHLGETELTGGVRVPRSDYAEVRRALTAAMEPGGIPTVIRLLDAHFGETPISIRSLFRDEQRRVLHQLIETTLDEAESTFRQLHERYDPLMRFHNRLGIPVPKVLRTAAEFDLNQQIRRLLDKELAPAELEVLLRELRDEGVTLDETTLVAFSSAIERASEHFRQQPEDLDRLEAFDAIVTLVKDARLTIDLRRAQNRYYRLRATVRPAVEATASTEARQWLAVFDWLGEKLAIAPLEE